MRNKCYICNAKQLNRVTRHTYSNTYNLAYSLVSKGNSFGCFAKLIRGIRSLFVHNAKLVRQMQNNNKQATKAKYSNLSHKLNNIFIGTLVAVSFVLLIADADTFGVLLLTKIAGGGLLLLSQYLFNKADNNPNEYENEYF